MNPKIVTLLALCILAVAGCGSDPLNHVPGMNPWIDGNPTELARFVMDAEEGPVVMINLLKFRSQATDGSGTGADAYARYAELATPLVERHGGKLVFSGATEEHLIGDTDYDWDQVLLVAWPSHQNLLDLSADEDYEKIAHHRTNALERTMLIAMKQD